jgi:hypothetical protein
MSIFCMIRHFDPQSCSPVLKITTLEYVLKIGKR